MTEGEFEVNIYNLTGKLVRTATETMINVTDLAKGCYLVKVTTAEAEKIVKFIKK
ncbi:T9SS type A sorting domain-containing protein [Barnesiella intestinihominis]|uniref:T9SS type A sorting domain-containing protein n=1 Tax=Barnesiella intestinihominis TaxID=487174 RepID=UPI0032C0757D